MLWYSDFVDVVVGLLYEVQYYNRNHLAHVGGYSIYFKMELQLLTF